MVKNFKLYWLSLTNLFHLRDPQLLVRTGMGLLLVANLIAAYFVFNPPGGSLEDLDEQVTQLRRQIVSRQAAADRLKVIVSKVSQAKNEGDQFMGVHFLARRTAYSTLLTELEQAAKTAGIKPRDHSFNLESIEGSETLGLLIMNANYEGTYADLVKFLFEIDRSKRFLIIETLQAQPQQGTPILAISLKVYAFIREDGGDIVSPAQAEAAPAKSGEPVALNAGGPR